MVYIDKDGYGKPHVYAAMVDLIDRKAHRNKTYQLTANKSVTDRKVAKALSIACECEIEHIGLGYHDYVTSVKSRGLPSWFAKDTTACVKVKASGIDENPKVCTHDLEKLIGRKPESFLGYLRNKESQRPGASFHVESEVTSTFGRTGTERR